MATQFRSEKFTPGPWLVDASLPVAVFEANSATGHIICLCNAEHRDDSTNIGNAHLIAAAPDLYEALEKLANEAQGFLSMADRQAHGNTNIAVMRERIRSAFDALVKARGEA